MRQRVVDAWLAAVLLGASFGCEAGASRHRYPDDPLLVGKRPVDGKADASPAELVASIEPVPPSVPPTAYATGGKPPPGRPAAAVAVIPPSGAGTAAVPAPEGAHPKTPQVPATLTGRRRVPGAYAHAADYRWLQGVLVRRTADDLTLRYAGPGEADRWGGRVRLEADDRLDSYADGDVLLVEGELTETTARGAGREPPCYRVRQVWLVKLAR
jgi:hypothetical protein